jgi:hypothetical protein
MRKKQRRAADCSKAAAAEEAVDALLEELHAAGTLAAEAIERIRLRIERVSETLGRDFNETHKLDRYF